jgi:hypothetical protein
MDPDTTTFSGSPINSNGRQFTLDIFPLLEEIVVYARAPEPSIGEDVCAVRLHSSSSLGHS